jgi:hypothetical protein
MGFLGTRHRNWRKARGSAVSTIIATILLVAITVVLAAVLYVLISGLTGGPTQTPIGGAFAASHPGSGFCAAGSAQTLGAAAITGGCKAGDFIYTVTVESSRVTFGSVQFEVRTAAGAVFAGAGATASIAVLDPATHVTAISITGPNLAMTSGWSGYGLTSTAPTYSASTPLTDEYLIVIDMGSSTSTTGQGLAFVAVGTGSFSGTTTPMGLP